MARIRTIKPEFWTDERIIECSLSARLLFIATWNFADDNGNLDASPKQIKARAFPADNINAGPLLSELIGQGLLIEYKAENKKYLHIQGFKKHQVINRKSKPQCPDYDESLSAHGTLSEHSLPEGKGREGKGREGITSSLRSDVSVEPEEVRHVFDHWQNTMAHPRAVLDAKRAKLITRWLKPDGYTADELCQAIDGCSKTPHNMGQNDTGTRYDDLGLILRDADHIDRFRRNAVTPPTPGANSHGTKTDQRDNRSRARRVNDNLRDIAEASLERERIENGGEAAANPCALDIRTVR